MELQKVINGKLTDDVKNRRNRSSVKPRSYPWRCKKSLSMRTIIHYDTSQSLQPFWASCLLKSGIVLSQRGDHAKRFVHLDKLVDRLDYCAVIYGQSSKCYNFEVFAAVSFSRFALKSPAQCSRITVLTEVCTSGDDGPLNRRTKLLELSANHNFGLCI